MTRRAFLCFMLAIVLAGCGPGMIVTVNPTPANTLSPMVGTSTPTLFAKATPSIVESPNACKNAAVVTRTENGNLHVRSEAKLHSAIVGYLKEGDEICLLGNYIPHTWIWIKTADGLTGYVYSDFVKEK